MNISEGRRGAVIDAIATEAGSMLLDVHRDVDHNRSVLTLGGPDEEVEVAVRRVASAAVETIDLRLHAGVHPRRGAVDVVPFVDLDDPHRAGPAAVAARDRFAEWAGRDLQLPCFLYGSERTLPDIRRLAFASLPPDTGPSSPHPTAGACSVGARPVLVAYNLWLRDADLAAARAVAAALRGPSVRVLALPVGQAVQVSCNLIEPWVVGPAQVFDAVKDRLAVARAELVGLVPADVLSAIPASRWAQLDLDASKTIESRLGEAGLDGGCRKGAAPDGS
jgi:glutamate formiminotransferase / 5-formyltetrahydrofolate cyclo-ligase